MITGIGGGAIGRRDHHGVHRVRDLGPVTTPALVGADAADRGAGRRCLA
jgi:hypothetical protein